MQKNPVILFVPVSSSQGVGEYTRSLILAQSIEQEIPQATIHFILNKHMSQGQSCPFQVHTSNHSATKDTPKVKQVIDQIRPDLVIFDCAGRGRQFSYAKSRGAKVVFIVQHRKKRARGLKLHRLLNSDCQWVVQPHFAIPPLNIIERLKLKLFKQPAPKNIGAILPKISPEEKQALLKKHELQGKDFFLFSAGSGAHEKQGLLIADIFYRAAKDFQQQTGIMAVMVFGPNYPNKLPQTGLSADQPLCFGRLNSQDFIILLEAAIGRVLGAGDTLLQSIELGKPSVAAVVSKDQPPRLAACEKRQLVLVAQTSEQDICDKAVELTQASCYQAIKTSIESLQPIAGREFAIERIKQLLASPQQATAMQARQPRRYLFFVTQDYSFPILRPLERAILKRGDIVQWFVYGDEVNPHYLQQQEKRLVMIEDVIEYMPDVVFVPGNVVPSFISGLKVEIFHGLPGTKRRKSGEIYHFIIRGMFDLYCTQGPSSTTRFQQLAEQYGYFKAVETGWCKLDPLFTKDEQPRKRKAIFFASTFSPRYSKAEVLYPLLLKMMQKYEFDWYITLHPKMDKSTEQKYRAINLPNVTFVETTELIESFRKTDLMLCDLSSIIYEYLTQLKPVITFQKEIEEAALINVNDIDKLEDKILEVLQHPSINQDNIVTSVADFHPYSDGASSERVLDVVEKMLAGKALPSKKMPFNFFRNYKLRKELNYWRW
ncbi:MAG: CDP-glycerol glycerophosphotransferase family protein [Enterobacterales bacterium]|nr:CDP-glycerol glycerophosphotransferase family protein [Enterobacterales bacterium]